MEAERLIQYFAILSLLECNFGPSNMEREYYWTQLWVEPVQNEV